MASKDDDNTPISPPIPDPPQHEAPIASIQPPTPWVHPPPSPTISIVIPPLSTAPPSMPLPQSQNEDSTRINQQKQQSSWSPSTPHPRRRSLDLNHQGVLSPITPAILTRSLSGSPDTPVGDVGENENRNASAPWGLASSQVRSEGKTVQFHSTFPAHPTSTEQNRHSSWFPSTPHPYRPDLDDQETQGRSITPFIPPLSTPSVSSFNANTSNDRAGVSADYHNSGRSPLNYPAPKPPVNDRFPNFQSSVGEAIPYYGDGVPRSAPWTPAGYLVLKPQANYPDGMAPGTALRYDGVRNPADAWGYYTPWVGMATATRDDEAATSTHPVTGPTSTHPTTTVPSTHPTTSTSTHPITNPSWAVHVYSQTLRIAGERLRRYQIVRSRLRFESQLNDLFSGSLGLWLRCFSFKEITGLTVHT